MGGLPPRLFGLGLLVLVVGGYLYFRHSQVELELQRGRVLSKQRAIASELGPRLLPLRDRIESAAQKLGVPQPPARFVAPGIDFRLLFGAPGLYFRAPASVTQGLETLRASARESLKDGFTACLLRDERAKAPGQGKACRESVECEPGELCSEYQACERPASPFNTRLLYRALSVLSESWTREVRDAKTDLSILAYERSLDSVTEVDIPVAIDVYQRSEYIVLVLDEMPEAGLPPRIEAETKETELERLARTPHWARVSIIALPDGKPLATLRARAEGALRDVGRRTVSSEKTEAARARQANSCALALDVRAQLGVDGVHSDAGAAEAGAADAAPVEPSTP